MAQSRGRLLVAALCLVGALALIGWLARDRTSELSDAPAGAEPVPAASAREPAREDPGALPEARPETRVEHVEIDPGAPPDSTDRQPYELRGIVRAGDGTPLAGASVTARRRDFSGFDLRAPAEEQAELLAEVESDARGEFRIALAAGARVDVEARKADLCPDVAADRGAGDFVELVLAEGLRVRGRVTRARDGSPVAGATVRVVAFHSSAATTRTTESAADGAYSLRVAAASSLLGVTPLLEQSTLLQPLRFDADGLCVLDVAVEDGVRVEGRVSERETGRPIPGARVREGRAGSRSVTTDARGEYVLTGFGNPDVAELCASADGYGSARGSLSAPVGGRMRVDFELARGRTARGRVVDPRGDPVAGARVLAVGFADGNEDWRGGHTQADGSFALADLAPELRHALLVAAPGRATQVHDFPADERERAEVELGTLVLRDARALRGRVVDDQGQGIAGAIASLRGWNSDRFELAGAGAEPAGTHYVEVRERWSDAAGRFAFEDLAAGDYRIAARAAGRVSTAERSVRVEDGVELAEIELRMPGGAGISGRVVDERGQPLAEIHVGLRVEALRDPGEALGEFPSSARTGADGGFEFAGLPAGEYALEVFPLVYAEEDLREPPLQTDVEHVLSGGAPLVVTMARGRVIEGLVQDARGAPLAGHRVQALDPAGAVAWQAYTDAGGRFAMPVKRDSTWALAVLGPTQAEGVPLLSVAGVPAGASDVLLVVPD